MLPEAININEHRRSIDVLLVEDNDIDARIVEIFIQMLDGLDIKITRMREIVNAEEILRHKKFDICLLDYWLGNECTFSLLGKIEKEYKNIKTVILSNITKFEVDNLRLTSDKSYFISKPECSVEKLHEAIHNLLPYKA